MTDADLVLGYLNPWRCSAARCPCTSTARARPSRRGSPARSASRRIARRRRHRGRRQRRHGRRAAHRVRRARLRPARVRPGGLRRRRARPRRAPRPGARDPPRRRAARFPAASPRWAWWRATSGATTCSTFYARLDGARAPEAIARVGAAMEAARGHAGARRRAARAPRDRPRRRPPLPPAGLRADGAHGAGPVTAATLARLAADFHDKHRMTYGHASPDEPVQLVNVRVSAVGRLGGLELGRGGAPRPAARRAGVAARAYFKETGPSRPATCSSRDALAPGARHAGPLIVEADGHHHRRAPGLARSAPDDRAASSCWRRMAA